jgi:DNA polymerase-3 subunit delta'
MPDANQLLRSASIQIPPVLAEAVGRRKAVAELGRAVREPRHAYLLRGPAGSGKLELAVRFAAALLCPAGGCAKCEDCAAALDGNHPDLALRRREGAYLRIEEARELTILAFRSPVRAKRQVIVVPEMHLMEGVAPALLKTVEEPPSSTVFVFTAENLGPELLTIASRCLVIDVDALGPEEVADILLSRGVDREAAIRAARAAHGRLDRTERYIGDENSWQREELWRTLPERLEARGAVVARAARELLSALDEASAVLEARHKEEIARQRRGSVGLAGHAEGDLAGLRERHRRELRRARVDELRAGLATLQSAYRDRLLAAENLVVARQALAAMDLIEEASRALRHNPKETLLLTNLLCRLAFLSSSGR